MYRKIIFKHDIPINEFMATRCIITRLIAKSQVLVLFYDGTILVYPAVTHIHIWRPMWGT